MMVWGPIVLLDFPVGETDSCIIRGGGRRVCMWVAASEVFERVNELNVSRVVCCSVGGRG